MNGLEAVDRGDVVAAYMNAQVGREQAGRRPFLVLTPKAYNSASSLVIGCPITSNLSDYAFKVALPEGAPVSGAVLVDQVRAIDPSARRAKVVGAVDEATVAAVTDILASLLNPPLAMLLLVGALQGARVCGVGVGAGDIAHHGLVAGARADRRAFKLFG